MDLESIEKEEIFNLLSSGEEVIIDTKNNPTLSKVISYYIDQLEINITYPQFSSSSNSEWQLLLNFPTVLRLYTSHSYVRKLGYAWRRLKWIKVKTDDVPPCNEYRLQYVHKKENMPSSVWGT